ncbi:MAG TPA: DUF456 domain-containing protein [Cerasibacillus sp.]|uniref:DUF456 domain-containing protein n=1 Tax=Cerasibacillus sp. TaxID=2498711 RepID=UPI002F42E776
MADIYLWILIILLFIVSFIGLVFPILPSSLLIWVGFLVYHFKINSTELGWLFWTMMIVFTVVLFLADIIANRHFVKRFGGSKLGENTAAIAVIIGSFFPPFGILVVPFIAVVAVELFQARSFQEAIRAATGSLIGFLGGTLAKIIIQFMMIIWFFIAVIF